MVVVEKGISIHTSVSLSTKDKLGMGHLSSSQSVSIGSGTPTCPLFKGSERIEVYITITS